MAISSNRDDLEKAKFVESTSTAGQAAIAVTNPDGSNISGGGGGGGGTEYNEDAAHVSGALGTQVLAVRRDADTTLVDTDGDYAPLQVNSTGSLKVEVTETVGGGGGGTEFNEDTAHSSGDLGTQVLAVRNDADTSLVDTDGDYAPLQVNSAGSVKTEVTESALPSGAATETTLSSVDTNTSTIAGDTTSLDSKVVTVDTDDTRQATHDNLNANANIQIGDVDVGAGNPVPVSDNGGSLTIDATSLPLPTGAATESTLSTIASNQLPDGHNVTVDNAGGASAVNIQDGGNSITVDATSLPLPTGASTAANQTTGNTTLSNINNKFPATSAAADNMANPTNSSIKATNMVYDGSTWDRMRGTSADGVLVNLGANNDVTVTGTVTVTQGTHDNLNANANIQVGDVDVSSSNPVPVEGPTAEGAAIATDPVLIAGKDLSNQVAVPTLLTAGGVNVFASLIADTAGQTLDIENSAATVTGDEAHDAADAGNPIKIGGKVETDPSGPTAVGDGDRVDAWFSDKGEQHVADHSHFSGSTTLTALNDTYDGTTTSNNSADISNDAGYRFADLLFTLESNGTPTRIRFIVQAKSGANYFDAGFSYMQSIYYEDTVFATAQNRWLHVPIPSTDSFRIRVEATGTDNAGNEFVITNAEIFLRS